MATTADSTATAWLRRFHPAAERGARRLVCFPHAGGSASFYHPVSGRFAPGTEVIAIQYPGRQDRRFEPCVDDVNVLADLIAEQLRALPAKPSLFFGHSMGTVVAFETARRLERTGHGPQALVVSGWRAPSRPFDEGIHRRDDAGLIAEIRKLDGTDAAVLNDEDIVRMALPSIRGDYRAIETYSADPSRRLRCPITVLVGDADPKVDPADAGAWCAHTTAGFRLKMFPGGHFYLITQQAAVGDELEAELDLWTAP